MPADSPRHRRRAAADLLGWCRAEPDLPGYVYGACEKTVRKQQLASAWTSQDAVDRSRLKTEREAFEGLLDDFETLLAKCHPTATTAHSPGA